MFFNLLVVDLFLVLVKITGQSASHSSGTDRQYPPTSISEQTILEDLRYQLGTPFP
jgi:hypothetical protein